MSRQHLTLRALEGEVRAGVDRLMRRAFGLGAGITQLETTTCPPDPAMPPYYFATIEDGQLACFNAFIPTPMRNSDGAPAVAFQSCWTATDPDQQGRGLWKQLMWRAHEELAPHGAFIFGVPNPNSHPIMVHKLGYREVPIVTTRIAAIPFLGAAGIGGAGLRPKGLFPDERKIAAAKRLGADLVTSEVEGGFAWGQRSKRVARGIPLTYLKVGGIDLGSTGASPRALMAPLFRRSSAYMQLVSSASHELNGAFRGWKPLDGVKPFVVHDFTSSPSDPLNFMFGVADVF